MEDLLKQIARFKRENPEFEVKFEIVLKPGASSIVLADEGAEADEESDPPPVKIQEPDIASRYYDKDISYEEWANVGWGGKPSGQALGQRKRREWEKAHPELAKHQKTCTVCEQPFRARMAHAKYCSEKCREIIYEQHKSWALERRARKYEGSDVLLECSFCGKPTRRGPWCSNDCRRSMEEVVAASLMPKPQRVRRIKLVGVRLEIIEAPKGMVLNCRKCGLPYRTVRPLSNKHCVKCRFPKKLKPAKPIEETLVKNTWDDLTFSEAASTQEDRLTAKYGVRVVASGGLTDPDEISAAIERVRNNTQLDS